MRYGERKAEKENGKTKNGISKEKTKKTRRRFC